MGQKSFCWPYLPLKQWDVTNMKPRVGFGRVVRWIKDKFSNRVQVDQYETVCQPIAEAGCSGAVIPNDFQK